MKITPTSLTLNQLFGSTNEQYVIPSYQRRYSWRERQVQELLDDIQLLEGSDTHLLGDIVCLSGSHVAGLNTLELVDGQQRLTTVAILLHCIRERLEQEDCQDLVSEVGRLVSARTLDGKSKPKVQLDSIDSKEFSRLLKDDHDDEGANDDLRSAFALLRAWVNDRSLEDLRIFLYRLQNQALIIRLDVSDAKDAFKLFETINNRGLRLSATDIIKNFLLGNAARFGESSLSNARESWAKLVRHLDGVSAELFFRYFVTAKLQRRVTRAFVVASFKWLFMNEVKEAKSLPERHIYVDDVDDETDEDDGTDAVDDASQDISDEAIYESVSFREFLNRLVQSAKIFGELVLAKTGNQRIDRRLRNLKMIKAAQTFGFLMHLRTGGCSDKHFLEVLQLTESFVLRRHVCRERSNDTERLFARLCAVTPRNPVPGTRKEYLESCPTDDKFREEFATVSFTSNIMDRARYCLEVIELSKHGKHDELGVLGTDDVHIEHIIPQKIKTKKAAAEHGDWVSYLGANADYRHQKFVSRIGNLTLFAGPLNCSASNNPFARKKEAYKASSFLITRDLVKRSTFKFKQVDERSRELAKLAVSLWPRP